ncbi:hypothetical protein J421_5866 (plasmid) [Gemmatirosa kalamazoonensis]|uniref:Uncharacterized protein n=1 Tax=Gemmatirosa kalamazoonensis TaxID=861299 RepID=W0RRS5_9BACT|nr:hypothetical protein J421_5866 [Gemmatirosa kalamazoonensis]
MALGMAPGAASVCRVSTMCTGVVSIRASTCSAVTREPVRTNVSRLSQKRNTSPSAVRPTYVRRPSGSSGPVSGPRMASRPRASASTRTSSGARPIGPQPE